ncbi:MAG: GIY-YIG nuclease family protein [Candidatus Aureabacteria bacterium]|nr:GIY-YIG nuclease family protein [Candidatus Auribacterota bacterium]
MAVRRWHVYIIRCRDGTLYTGVTNDLERRINDHNRGTGCRYTRGRGPVKLLYRESFRSRSSALRREARIKALGREEKLMLIGKAL